MRSQGRPAAAEVDGALCSPAFTKPEAFACAGSVARRPCLSGWREGHAVQTVVVRAGALRETFRQYRASVVTAEALVWHHGYKGLDAALKAAENPTGDLRENLRAELVAKFAADRYLCFKHADILQRAAMLEVWSRRRGQMIRVADAPLAEIAPAIA